VLVLMLKTRLETRWKHVRQASEPPRLVSRRVFGFTQSSKPGMSEPVGFGPFKELDLYHNLRSQPGCFFHRLGVEFEVEAAACVSQIANG
jgi:hypothetical protein